MIPQKRWSALISVLALSLLACAPCGLSSFLDRVDSEAIVAEAEAIVESAAQEAAGTVSEEAENSETEQSSEVTAEDAAQPGNESEEADEVAIADEAATGGGAAVGEGVALPVDDVNIQGLFENDYIKSYEAEYYLKAESPDETVEIMIFASATRDPFASHFVVEMNGGAAAQSGFEQMEFYALAQDGGTNLYIHSPQQGDEWFSIRGDVGDAFDMSPISPYTRLPEKSEYMGQVEMNGFTTDYYVYNEGDFQGVLPGLTKASGELWLMDMDIIIKLVQKLEGINVPGLTTQSGQASSYEMRYEIKRLNDDTIQVTPPDEALNSLPFGIPGVGGDDSNDDGFDMPEGAQVELGTGNMVSYTIAQSVPEVLDYYKKTWGEENVEITIETPSNIMATYNDQQLIIVDENGITRVLITK